MVGVDIQRDIAPPFGEITPRQKGEMVILRVALRRNACRGIQLNPLISLPKKQPRQALVEFPARS